MMRLWLARLGSQVRHVGWRLSWLLPAKPAAARKSAIEEAEPDVEEIPQAPSSSFASRIAELQQEEVDAARQAPTSSPRELSTGMYVLLALLVLLLAVGSFFV
ncbi:MAG: hypothetical protein R3E93_15495 [Thiothrix sp.]